MLPGHSSWAPRSSTVNYQFMHRLMDVLERRTSTTTSTRPSSPPGSSTSVSSSPSTLATSAAVCDSSSERSGACSDMSCVGSKHQEERPGTSTSTQVLIATPAPRTVGRTNRAADVRANQIMKILNKCID